MSRVLKGQNGTLTVEAAIALPIFICVIFTMISFIKVVYIYDCVQYAITQSVEEIAAQTYVISRMDRDNVGFGISETCVQQTNTKLDEFYTRFGFQDGINENLEQTIFYIMIKQMVKGHLEEVSGAGRMRFFGKDHIQGGMDGLDFSESIFLSENENTHINVVYTMKIPLPVPILPKIRIAQNAIARVWLNGYKETENIQEIEDLWKLPPFQRGRAIQVKYGRDSNIPFNFPVAAKFQNGAVTSIKSINLRDQTYQNSKQIVYKVNGYIRDLRDFNGGKLGEFEIRPENITNKELLLVVPRGSVGKEQEKALKECEKYAAKEKILMIIKEL